MRQAEQRLLASGLGRDPSDRVKILSELYYGAPWSRDYDVEQSEVRNLGFQIYTRRPWRLPRAGPDPRAALGPQLFAALKRSQDVRGVDMGHVLIGMSARASSVARTEGVVPGAGASVTGLEAVTWVGDLGGAAARVALDRTRNPSAGVARYFTGTDYGARSNLEGDVSAYTTASGTGPVSEPTAPILPASGSIADALAAHFVRRGGRRSRYRRFLEMLGGRFTGGQLANRGNVETTIAGKLATFAPVYLVNYLRQRGRLNRATLLRAYGLIPGASRDVARRFTAWLTRR